MQGVFSAGGRALVPWSRARKPHALPRQRAHDRCLTCSIGTLPLRLSLPLAFAVLAALGPAAVHGQTLTDVWRAAAQHDPEFAAAQAARDAGHAHEAQAAALWQPQVALEAGAALASVGSSMRGARFEAPGLGTISGARFATTVDEGTRAMYAVSLRRPLYDRERSAQQQVLQTMADASGLAWIDAQQKLMLRSAERYFDAALAAERLALLQRQKSAVERAATEVQDRFQLGNLAITDTYAASARAASLRAQHLAASTELELSRTALSDLTGGVLPSAGTLALPGDAASTEGVGELSRWLDLARQHNPAVLLAQARVETAVQETRKSDTAFSPTVDLVARLGHERLSGQSDTGATGQYGRQALIGVQLTMPLHTGGAREARQRETQARLAQARAELDHARLQVARHARAAWLALSVGHEQARALEAAAQASQARLDATRLGVDVGDRNTLDLLNAENDAAAAKLALTQARVELLLHRLRLSALAGQLNETELARVDAMLANGAHRSTDGAGR